MLKVAFAEKWQNTVNNSDKCNYSLATKVSNKALSDFFKFGQQY